MEELVQAIKESLEHHGLHVFIDRAKTTESIYIELPNGERIRFSNHKGEHYHSFDFYLFDGLKEIVKFVRGDKTIRKTVYKRKRRHKTCTGLYDFLLEQVA